MFKFSVQISLGLGSVGTSRPVRMRMTVCLFTGILVGTKLEPKNHGQTDKSVVKNLVNLGKSDRSKRIAGGIHLLDGLLSDLHKQILYQEGLLRMELGNMEDCP